MSGLEWLVLFAIGLPVALIATDSPGYDDDAFEERADADRLAEDAYTVETGKAQMAEFLAAEDDDAVIAAFAGVDMLEGGAAIDLTPDAASHDAPAGGDTTTVEGFDAAEDVLVVPVPEGEAPTLVSQSVQDDTLTVTFSNGSSVVLPGVTAPISPDSVVFVDA
ncbi:hypothetical protein [Lacimonas salitolerans]|uniref:Uncharacterized protein n=1 Tax=Lacimonas salitolerans TaxID=1323750 RepID=A0ABW4EG76_9RHOB